MYMYCNVPSITDHDFVFQLLQGTRQTKQYTCIVNDLCQICCSALTIFSLLLLYDIPHCFECVLLWVEGQSCNGHSFLRLLVIQLNKGFFQPGMESHGHVTESQLNCDSIPCPCDSMPGWNKEPCSCIKMTIAQC